MPPAAQSGSFARAPIAGWYTRGRSADVFLCLHVLRCAGVVFELALKLQLEMEVHADGNLKTILTGKLTLPEVSNDDLDEARLPSGCKFTCEQAGWKPFFEAAAKASWGGIKTNCTRLVESAKAKWGA